MCTSVTLNGYRIKQDQTDFMSNELCIIVSEIKDNNLILIINSSSQYLSLPKQQHLFIWKNYFEEFITIDTV